MQNMENVMFVILGVTKHIFKKITITNSITSIAVDML